MTHLGLQEVSDHSRGDLCSARTMGTWKMRAVFGNRVVEVMLSIQGHVQATWGGDLDLESVPNPHDRHIQGGLLGAARAHVESGLG